jgi:hypothetical protein
MRQIARSLILVFGVLAGVSPVAAQTSPPDFQPAKDGIILLRQFPNGVRQVQDVIRGANFGPFQWSGQCGVDCFIVCWRDFKWEFRWGPEYLRNALAWRYDNVGRVSSTFDSSFQPVKVWLTGTLTNFSNTFDGASQDLERDRSVIQNPLSTPGEKQRAAGNIQQTLATLVAALQNDSQQLSGGITTLSQFNASLGASLRQVEDARGALNQALDALQNNFNTSTANWPECGRNAAAGATNQNKEIVRLQYQIVFDTAQRLGVTAGESDRAVSLILGSVLNVQNQYRGVLDRLRAAQITPVGAVQELWLNVAGAKWRDLADYARRELQ